MLRGTSRRCHRIQHASWRRTRRTRPSTVDVGAVVGLHAMAADHGLRIAPGWGDRTDCWITHSSRTREA
eukprot:112526-Alexandrium_andersonii.AAC.1